MPWARRNRPGPPGTAIVSPYPETSDFQPSQHRPSWRSGKPNIEAREDLEPNTQGACDNEANTYIPYDLDETYWHYPTNWDCATALPRRSPCCHLMPIRTFYIRPTTYLDLKLRSPSQRIQTPYQRSAAPIVRSTCCSMMRKSMSAPWVHLDLKIGGPSGSRCSCFECFRWWDAMRPPSGTNWAKKSSGIIPLDFCPLPYIAQHEIHVLLLVTGSWVQVSSCRSGFCSQKPCVSGQHVILQGCCAEKLQLFNYLVTCSVSSALSHLVGYLLSLSVCRPVSQIVS